MSAITALELEHGKDLDLAQTQLLIAMEGTSYVFDLALILIILWIRNRK